MTSEHAAADAVDSSVLLLGRPVVEACAGRFIQVDGRFDGRARVIHVEQALTMGQRPLYDCSPIGGGREYPER